MSQIYGEKWETLAKAVKAQEIKSMAVEIAAPCRAQREASGTLFHSLNTVGKDAPGDCP